MGSKWRKIKYSIIFDRLVPRSSGVYAILKINRVYGIPTSSSTVYVGKTKNLQRRFKEHLNRSSEENSALADLIGESAIEFWFQKTSENEMHNFEKTLIKETKPEANRILYKN